MANPRKATIRWAGIALTQLGYVNNLFLTFATAALGFALALLKDKDFDLPPSASCLFLISLAALLLSVVFGMLRDRSPYRFPHNTGHSDAARATKRGSNAAERNK